MPNQHIMSASYGLFFPVNNKLYCFTWAQYIVSPELTETTNMKMSICSHLYILWKLHMHLRKDHIFQNWLCEQKIVYTLGMSEFTWKCLYLRSQPDLSSALSKLCEFCRHLKKNLSVHLVHSSLKTAISASTYFSRMKEPVKVSHWRTYHRGAH